ncbi:MAG: toll/interleukin-1 receptor domain-containing protein [Candidatus Binatia bacterium]
MAKAWGWRLNHTLSSKRYTPYENGRISSANLTNSGEAFLHIYGFGIEFEWQRETDSWWSESCDIFLKTGEEANLPVVGFSIPINVDLGRKACKYKLGVLTESKPEDGESAAEWKDHGIVWAAREFEVELVRHPDRNYMVFLSHSNHPDDKAIVERLAALLLNNGIKHFIAEKVPKYGEILWKKIKSAIMSADKVIILWTKHGAKSDEVREELGITVGARRKFIPIVERNVEPKGSLIGTEYVRIQRDNYEMVIVTLTEELIKSSVEKARRVKKVKPQVKVPQT